MKKLILNKENRNSIHIFMMKISCWKKHFLFTSCVDTGIDVCIDADPTLIPPELIPLAGLFIKVEIFCDIPISFIKCKKYEKYRAKWSISSKNDNFNFDPSQQFQQILRLYSNFVMQIFDNLLHQYHLQKITTKLSKLNIIFFFFLLKAFPTKKQKISPATEEEKKNKTFLEICVVGQRRNFFFHPQTKNVIPTSKKIYENPEYYLQNLK